VSCELARTTLHGYFDGELDAARSAEFEDHLSTCSDCATALETQDLLRSSLHRAQLYEKAPSSLRNRVIAGLQQAVPPPAVLTRPGWQWLSVAAALLLIVYASWRFLPGSSEGDEAQLAAQVVDAHLRSLQPGHLSDVVSTDQHTVKPWFDGRLDFAPPVRDLAIQGFPLQGGRLDVVHGRTVAALVYGRRKHIVSVFIWPTSRKDISLGSGSAQGYQWLDWCRGGMEFWAVSDVAASDLGEFQRLLTP